MLMLFLLQFWSININLRLLKLLILLMLLLLFSLLLLLLLWSTCCYWSHYVQLLSMNVILKASVEFVWWGGGGGVCTVIFMSTPTTVLRLCCRWGCDNNPSQKVFRASMFYKRKFCLGVRIVKNMWKPLPHINVGFLINFMISRACLIPTY